MTHAYQDMLLNSKYAKLLAVRKVSQDNRGKKTPGVDGISAIDQRHRLSMAKKLNLDGKASPIRRVFIPKPGKTERRPLGIPTLNDRAKQALAKLALEPQWEARFEPNSYGFRPGRSCHDAIEAIFKSIHRTPKGKYVLDADISKCFDTIDHDKLLQKLDVGQKMKRQIRAWLKAGVLEFGSISNTRLGTPQGGVISPLLSNIALHGLEHNLKNWIVRQEIRNPLGITLGKEDKRKGLSVIRYADDFVVLHKDEHIIIKVKSEVDLWLKTHAKLELSKAKTRLGHTDKLKHGKIGFNFLGFNIRRYATTQYGSNRLDTGMKTLIKPSRESIRSHMDDIGHVLHTHQSAESIISQLTPIIRGWCNYFKTGTSTEAFARLRHYMFIRLLAWARKKHPKQNLTYLYRHYFIRIHGQLQFGTTVNINGKPTRVSLKYHNMYHIERHVKVRQDKSPYDGDLGYWGQRLRRYAGKSNRVMALLRRQRGLCQTCKLAFGFDCVLEVDHIEPLSQGGKDQYNNLQLLHAHCHDQKKEKDVNLSFEEPYEAKVSRTVLK